MEPTWNAVYINQDEIARRSLSFSFRARCFHVDKFTEDKIKQQFLQQRWLISHLESIGNGILTYITHNNQQIDHRTHSYTTVCEVFEIVNKIMFSSIKMAHVNTWHIWMIYLLLLSFSFSLCLKLQCNFAQKWMEDHKYNFVCVYNLSRMERTVEEVLKRNYDITLQSRQC